MKIDLIKLENEGDIAVTGEKVELPIHVPNLANNLLDVYNIPLKYLYYSNENGRISTQVIQGSGDDSLTAPQDLIDKDEYNEKIAQFIIEDNPKALKDTKKSIKHKGQQVYGYVLSDGRIIDGNRRFTALREIEEETQITQVFKAVVLPFDYQAKAHRTQIKKLELAIQMGLEERLPYDPIDLALDIYRTVEIDETMTEKEYSLEADMKVKEVKTKIETIKLIHDFLFFINAPKDAYHIIKEIKLYLPIEELAKKLNKSFPDKGPKYEQTKITAFTMLSKFVAVGGDTVRDMREYSNKIMKLPINDPFNEAMEDTIDDLRDRLEEEPTVSADQFKQKLDKCTDELREVTEEYTKTILKLNRGENVENFMKEIQNIQEVLADMEHNGGLTGRLKYSDFSASQLKTIHDQLIKIQLSSRQLIGVFDNEF